jgi:Multicopper oxidase
MLFSPDGTGSAAPVATGGPEFDLTRYGGRARTPFDAASTFDREFDVVLDDWLGFYDGAFALRQTVNGRVYPDTPMHVVSTGDLIRMRFTNRGDEHHPMHLHGHHFLVLSRNGTRPTGSPVWLDTVNVRAGEVWEIGFRADNPGVWMDHCHNFRHAALGMVLHLAYANVTTPYLVGGAPGNSPG